MTKIEIFEPELTTNDGSKGKLVILRGGLNTENPTALMNAAVSKRVGSEPYNEFVEIYLDNPWVRVIIFGINEFDYKPFDL